MNLLGRRRSSLPADLAEDLASHLGTTPGRLRVLAWGLLDAGTGTVVALPDGLALHESGQWRVLPWTDVDKGVWNPERSTFTLSGGDRERLVLRMADPGRLPEVVRERVQASIVITQQLRVPGGEVLLTGRRTPGSSDPLVWHADSTGKADLTDPATAAHVVAVTQHLRTEYDDWRG